MVAICDILGRLHPEAVREYVNYREIGESYHYHNQDRVRFCAGILCNRVVHCQNDSVQDLKEVEAGLSMGFRCI